MDYLELVQQGDVLFKEVRSFPEGLTKSKATVFAEGEVTGHAHRPSSVQDVDFYEDSEGILWCETKKEVEVTHEEHGAVKVKPGKYEIGIVREVDPFEDAVRQVAD